MAARSAAPGGGAHPPRPSASTGWCAMVGCRSSRATAAGMPGEEIAEGLPAPDPRARRPEGAPSRRSRQPDLDRVADRADMRARNRRSSRPCNARPARRSRAARESGRAGVASIHAGLAGARIRRRCRCRAPGETREQLRRRAGRGTARTASRRRSSTSITAAEPVKSSPYQASERAVGAGRRAMASQRRGQRRILARGLRQRHARHRRVPGVAQRGDAGRPGRRDAP